MFCYVVQICLILSAALFYRHGCRVLGILSGIAGGSEELDVERMRTVLRRKICTTLNQVH